MKIPVAVILDEMQIQPWQQDSLDIASDLIDIKLILNCKNTATKKNYLKNFFYYLLNIFSMQFGLNHPHLFSKQKIRVIDFSSEYSGIWQSIPADVISSIKKEKINLIIKFGMNLLSVSDELNGLDIMSFHHGNPNEYRGRPAGFYEILNGADKVGAIVQLLSNKLDGGNIAAKGFTTLYPYSYKKTLKGLYQNSAYLLMTAIINYKNNHIYSQSILGRNYQLPNNIVTLKFILKIFFSKVNRFFQAAFFEKRWNIAIYNSNLNFIDQSELSFNKSVIPKLPKKYEFYADPFFSSDALLLRVEALNKWTRKGEIIELNVEDLSLSKTLLSGYHFSYPCSISFGANEFLFPEAAEHQKASFYNLSLKNEMKSIPINGMEEINITDPTVLNYKGYFYIFCNHLDAPNDRLHLYLSDNFFGPFVSHPCSPVVIDPESARMAGNIFLRESTLYRFGQNNISKYGKEISVNQIVKLSPTEYIEKRVNTLRYSHAYGPHTINFKANQTVTDFYEEKFSLVAGLKRVIGLIAFKCTR
jgi:hypothetical protein